MHGAGKNSNQQKIYHWRQTSSELTRQYFPAYSYITKGALCQAARTISSFLGTLVRRHGRGGRSLLSRPLLG